MKLVQIHSLSLIIGAVLFCIGSLLVGAQQTPTVTGAPTDVRSFAEAKVTLSGPIEVQGIPTPAQLLTVNSAEVFGGPIVIPHAVDATLYTVPAGKSLVLTYAHVNRWDRMQLKEVGGGGDTVKLVGASGDDWFDGPGNLGYGVTFASESEVRLRNVSGLSDLTHFSLIGYLVDA